MVQAYFRKVKTVHSDFIVRQKHTNKEVYEMIKTTRIKNGTPLKKL